MGRVEMRRGGSCWEISWCGWTSLFEVQGKAEMESLKGSLAVQLMPACFLYPSESASNKCSLFTSTRAIAFQGGARQWSPALLLILLLLLPRLNPLKPSAPAAAAAAVVPPLPLGAPCSERWGELSRAGGHGGTAPQEAGDAAHGGGASDRPADGSAHTGGAHVPGGEGGWGFKTHLLCWHVWRAQERI